MKIAGRAIDHIVYAVPNLEEAVRLFENDYGLSPIIGGRHNSKGTKNALVNLGDGVYLEILAVDHENQKIKAPRWMGIDLINKAKITRWSIKSNDLEKDQTILQSVHPEMGFIEEGEREALDGSMLKWKMTLPLATPEVSLIPFMTDWSLSTFHPTDRLNQNCSLQEIHFTTNKGDLVSQKCFDKLFNGLEVSVGDFRDIHIAINGPRGLFKI